VLHVQQLRAGEGLRARTSHATVPQLLHVQQLRAGEGLRARTSRATVPQSLYLRCTSHALQTAAAVPRIYAEGKSGPGARAPLAACPRSALRQAPTTPCCRACPAHRSPCPRSYTARHETSCDVIAKTKTRNQLQKPRRSLKRTHVQHSRPVPDYGRAQVVPPVSSSSGAESDLLKSPEQACTTSSNLVNSDPRMGDCARPATGGTSRKLKLPQDFNVDLPAAGSPPTKMILYYTQKTFRKASKILQHLKIYNNHNT
jgi:hypothetical protein